jgi:hypothetical protein
MEVFISFLAGFSIGWGSVWFIFSMNELKEIEIEVKNNEDSVWYN